MYTVVETDSLGSCSPRPATPSATFQSARTDTGVPLGLLRNSSSSERSVKSEETVAGDGLWEVEAGEEEEEREEKSSIIHPQYEADRVPSDSSSNNKESNGKDEETEQQAGMSQATSGAEPSDDVTRTTIEAEAYIKEHKTNIIDLALIEDGSMFGTRRNNLEDISSERLDDPSPLQRYEALLTTLTDSLPASRNCAPKDPLTQLMDLAADGRISELEDLLISHLQAHPTDVGGKGRSKSVSKSCGLDINQRSLHFPHDTALHK
eukprot:CAMPEP_0198222492 /NCGR_PEP_ID=MMETSP1445-20131203/88302_1 /TAXON_ID=36898 /ORGANISM="Pyramimonas sp., Strain CCMP2087" /LENGTH=263 /DNA_ID=CAMNT_0043901007 /DNA_START=296 /DNA_END=1084 /DNA_ORIENTATION=+